MSGTPNFGSLPRVGAANESEKTVLRVHRALTSSAILVTYAALTGLAALATVIGTFTTSGSHIAFFFGGVVGTVMLAIFGALFYATIGWLVETLSMLTQIARNTVREAV
jgi:hypothetical protein